MRNAIHILKTLIHSSYQLPQAGAMGGSTGRHQCFGGCYVSNNMSVLGMQWSVIWMGYWSDTDLKSRIGYQWQFITWSIQFNIMLFEFTISYQQQAAELTYNRRSKQQRDSSLVEGYFRNILLIRWQMFLLHYKLWSKWTNIEQQCFLSLHFS